MKMKFGLLALFLGVLFTSTSALFTSPSREEILEEIAFIRKNNESLRLNFNTDARNLMDEISEQKVLEQANGRWDYWTKYATFWFPAFYLKSLGFSIVLLTKENAPKTYVLIEEMASKVGLTTIPLVYLVSDKNFLNVMTAGFLQSMSAILIGEELFKETTSTIEEMKFWIGHEMTHIKKRHALKAWVFAFALNKVINKIYEKLPTEYQYNYDIPLWGRLFLDITVLNLSYLAINTYLGRYYEHEADLGAAQIVGINAASHTLDMVREKIHPNTRIDDDFKTLQEAIDQSSLKDARWYNLRVKMAYMFSKISHAIGQYFITHPTPQKRITYLERMMKEQNNMPDTSAA